MMNTFVIQKKTERFTIDVTFSFAEGTMVLTGESGAGKTTILNCIAGLMTPESGRISVGGHVLYDQQNKINLVPKDRNIGYVFQQYALFPHMTVWENIVYGINNQPKDKRRELRVYAHELLKSFGLEYVKNKYPRNISGGEKQRTAFARAVVTKPDLLLLDEPFSALDSKTKELMHQEYLAFKTRFKIPTILITHSPEEAKKLGDFWITLNDGMLKEAD
jgi:molybdate transport system ATP-binding protein